MRGKTFPIKSPITFPHTSTQYLESEIGGYRHNVFLLDTEYRSLKEKTKILDLHLTAVKSETHKTGTNIKILLGI